MRKVLVGAIVLLMLMTPLLAQDDPIQQDQAVLETLGEYGERIQTLEELIESLKEQPELAQQKIQELFAQDRFLWTKFQSSFQDLEMAIREIEQQISDIDIPVQQPQLDAIHREIQLAKNRLTQISDDNLEQFLTIQRVAGQLNRVESYLMNLEQDFEKQVLAIQDMSLEQFLTVQNAQTLLDNRLTDLSDQLLEVRNDLEQRIYTVQDQSLEQFLTVQKDMDVIDGRLKALQAEVSQKHAELEEWLIRVQDMSLEQFLTVQKDVDLVASRLDEIAKTLQDHAEVSESVQSLLISVEALQSHVEVELRQLHASIPVVEEIRSLNVIVDLLAEKVQELAGKLKTDPNGPEVINRIQTLEQAIQELRDNDQFLWRKIQATADLLEESEALIHAFIQERMHSLNQRIRWLESLVQSMRNQKVEVPGLEQALSEIHQTIGVLEAELVNTRDMAFEQFLTAQGDITKIQIALNRLQPRVVEVEEKQQDLEESLYAVQKSLETLAHNDRFLWQRIQQTKEQIELLDQALNQQLQDRVISINQRIRWLETVVERVKNTALTQDQFQSALKEIDDEIHLLRAQLIDLQDMGLEQFLTAQKDTDVVRTGLVALEAKVIQLQEDLPGQLVDLGKTLDQSRLLIEEDVRIIQDHLHGLQNTLVASLAHLSQELEYVRIEASAVTVEDVKTLGLLVDIISGKIQEMEGLLKQYQSRNLSQDQLIAQLFQKIDELAANDRFLWVRLRQVQQQLDQQMQDLEAKVDMTLEDRFRSVNLRFRWLETQVQKLAQQTPILIQKVETLESRAQQVDQDWVQLIDRISQMEASLETNRWSTNLRLRWIEVQVEQLKQDTATIPVIQQELLTALNQLEDGLQSQIQSIQWASNMRMRWMETQIEKLKTETAQIPVIERQLLDKIQALEQEHRADIAQMSQKLTTTTDQLQSRMTGMHQEIDRSLDTLENQLQSQINNLTLRVSHTEGFEAQINTLQQQTKDLDDRTSTLENQVIQLSSAVSTAFMVAVAGVIIGSIALFK